MALTWDPAEHPRVPGGEHGGQFTRRPGGGNLTQSDLRGRWASTEQVEEAAALDIATRWKVSDGDLRELAAEEGINLPADPKAARETVAR